MEICELSGWDYAYADNLPTLVSTLQAAVDTCLRGYSAREYLIAFEHTTCDGKWENSSGALAFIPDQIPVQSVISVDDLVGFSSYRYPSECAGPSELRLFAKVLARNTFRDMHDTLVGFVMPEPEELQPFGRKLNAMFSPDWSGEAPGNFNMMPYTEEAAQFFHGTLLGLDKLARDTEAFINEYLEEAGLIKHY
jgi:hypothetical protein